MGSISDDLRPTKQQVVSWCISFQLGNDVSRKEPFKLLGRTTLPIEIIVIVETIKITSKELRETSQLIFSFKNDCVFSEAYYFKDTTS